MYRVKLLDGSDYLSLSLSIYSHMLIAFAFASKILNLPASYAKEVIEFRS